MPAFTFDTWIGIAGLAVGGIATALSIYFYRRSIQMPAPCFGVHPLRVKLVDKSDNVLSGLQVLHNDKPINAQNVTAATVCFWNEGKGPIRHDDVLKQYTIEVGDVARMVGTGEPISRFKILDWKITAISRDVCGFLVSPRQEPNQLTFDFLVVEQNDAVAIQIIYSGDPDSSIRLEGSVIGADTVKNTDLRNILLNITPPFAFVSILVTSVLGLGLMLFATFIRPLDSMTQLKINLFRPQAPEWISIGLAVLILVWIVLVRPRLYKKHAVWRMLDKASHKREHT